MADKSRFYLVVDVDSDFEGSLHGVAAWADIKLSSGTLDATTTAYRSIEDMVADRDEKAGAWETP